MSNDTMLIIKDVFFYALPILFSLSFHEAAHAYMAEKKGDSTAALMGRKTLNPLSHIDPIGTVVLPALLIIFKVGFVFGWAKPVPVNPLNLKNRKKDMMWISLAGPASNIILAIAFALASRLLLMAEAFISNSILTPLILLFNIAIFFNLVLAFFNLIPLPPLDGSKILAYLLPKRYSDFFDKIERYSLIIFIALIYTGFFKIIIYPVFFFYQLLAPSFLPGLASSEDLLKIIQFS